MLKLGPQSKESANFFNKGWVIDGTMIVEEYLGTSDGAARSPPLAPRRRDSSAARYREIFSYWREVPERVSQE